MGPYRLLDKLGEGGMGVVYRALDDNDRAVAIKVLRAHVAHDEGARERLRREVDTLSRVRSASVAAVLDADVDGDRPFLVTQFVPGPPLDEVVESQGPFTPAQLARLGRGLADALRAIHAAGVVHRDLKPGNVLMVQDRPVIIDFGIAHVADDSRLTQTGLVMGTPGYLSPEIIDGAEVTEATDWWGWAATLAYAASGTAPFGRGPMPVVLDRVARGQADLRRVDPRIRPLLEAALDPDPRLRPDAPAVLRELEVYASGGQTGSIARPDATARLAAAPPTEVTPRRQSTARLARREPTVPQRNSQPTTPARPRPTVAPAYDRGVAASRADEAAYRPPPMDPRIGQPPRTGTLAALLAGLVALGAVMPVFAWALLFCWTFAARWADRSVTSMVLRWYAAGRRKSDTAIAVVLSPWHAVLAALSTLLVVLLPAFLGAIAAALTAVGCSALGFDGSVMDRPIPLAAATLVAGWTVWWGPGGTSTRRGSRSLVRWTARNVPITRIVVGLALALAALCLLIASIQLHEAANWWPYADSSQVPGAGLVPGLPSLGS
ncbi:protein kinase [Calidifontibacter sp. DB0510]|uniref:Protein kinase n=1 Tax=Metallococcus carri TaxID=1656884 RepID=A0A967EGV0_9MICO|nr:protein kinase [Metallococcus carri]NOP38268.1 protein kinase [Calidifontibacter sp. DB2511S]